MEPSGPEPDAGPLDPDGAAVATSLGLGAVSQAARITGGADADTWRVVCGGEPLALRVLPPGRDAEGELAALRRAAERGVPVPTVVASGHHQGRSVLVTTWCAGAPMGELLRAGVDPVALGRHFGRVQRQLHRPDADGTVLCHLDYQPFNVLFEATRVTAVVDWANARAADPRADVATTAVILRFAAERDSASGTDTVEPFAAAWRAGYGRFPPRRELLPFLHDAADVQRATWRRRVDAGEARGDVLAAAQRVVDFRW